MTVFLKPFIIQQTVDIMRYQSDALSTFSFKYIWNAVSGPHLQDPFFWPNIKKLVENAADNMSVCNDPDSIVFCEIKRRKKRIYPSADIGIALASQSFLIEITAEYTCRLAVQVVFILTFNVFEISAFKNTITPFSELRNDDRLQVGSDQDSGIITPFEIGTVHGTYGFDIAVTEKLFCL